LFLASNQYERYKRAGIEKIRKTNIAPPLFGAALLNRFRIYIVTQLIRDIKPPNPSFQRAKMSPVRATPQIIKSIIIRGLKDGEEDPLFLPNPSIRFAIPKASVNITREVPVILAVHLINVRGRFFFIIPELFKKNSATIQIYCVFQDVSDNMINIMEV
jgi:hypothetical protein